MKESLIAQPSQLSLRHFKNRILDIDVFSFKRRKSNRGDTKKRSLGSQWTNMYWCPALWNERKSVLIGWPGLCSRANKQYYFSPIKHDNCTIPHRSPLVSHWAGANTPRLHHWHPVQYRNQRSCRYWKTWPSLYHKTGSTIPANINESNNAGLSSWNLHWKGLVPFIHSTLRKQAVR